MSIPISTRDLSGLPHTDRLRELLRSLAMLDAILCPEWESRYYSFNSRWGAGEEMGSMRNRQGDDFFALFNSYGCFLKGFAHESSAVDFVDRAIHYQGIPSEFSSCVTEPAFKPDEVTFCIWRACTDSEWMQNGIALPDGVDPDGSVELLSPLDGQPETYWQWAESYYERDVSLSAVQAIYERRPLTGELVALLNPELRMKQLQNDIREIGYPM